MPFFEKPKIDDVTGKPFDCECSREKCGHRWLKRDINLPDMCPKCVSRNWR